MVAFVKVRGTVHLNGHYFVFKLNLSKADKESPAVRLIWRTSGR